MKQLKTLLLAIALVCIACPATTFASGDATSKVRDAEFQISIRPLDGALIPLTVMSSYTIDNIKGMINDREGIPVNDIRLIFAGKMLEDGRTLADYNIGKNAIVHMVWKRS